MTLNKGTIWVDSQLNIGSTFYVELPKNKIYTDDKLILCLW
ncbi:cell wall metabolism sensor histidine kinase WalK [Psychroserpens sp. NJDZ02]|nr:cell wall metabolism sensor histidine kinase WalK [Psychroserpens sp. NJDZ02]